VKARAASAAALVPTLRLGSLRLGIGVLSAMGFSAVGLSAPAPLPAPAALDAATYAIVTPGYALTFPRDYGSHPQFRTEWWYATGWLTTQRGATLGFQITFFRTRPARQEDNPSAFAARQLLIAHSAISDPARGRLWQDQRIRRAGLSLAEAQVGDTDVWIDDWQLKRAGETYAAKILADGFGLDLKLAISQPPLLNGDAGYSQKGPAREAASYYYSQPHLRVNGTVMRGTVTEAVSGEAWLDHEWSSQYLDPQADGWDWIGLNLNDGGALMAFQIRDHRGQTHWAGGTMREANGQVHSFPPAQIRFVASRRWRSPRTGISYPISWRVRAGEFELDLEPLLDDQENDTRLSSGAIYWEGAVRAYKKNTLAGRGYLELTGYDKPLDVAPP